MTKKPTERSPAEYDDEKCLYNESFIPHLLTIANNSYAWNTSNLYINSLDLGINEIRILSILYEYGELQAWKICDILYMNKAIVSQCLRNLEKRDLVEIEKRRDGRFARPTEKSVPVHRQIVRMARSREEILLQGFSQEERMKFIDFLRRFHHNINDVNEYANKHFLGPERNKILY